MMHGPMNIKYIHSCYAAFLGMCKFDKFLLCLWGSDQQWSVGRSVVLMWSSQWWMWLFLYIEFSHISCLFLCSTFIDVSCLSCFFFSQYFNRQPLLISDKAWDTSGLALTFARTKSETSTLCFRESFTGETAAAIETSVCVTVMIGLNL